ncbi:MAG: dihydropteroate synthase, partial [Candidatus Hydrogenedens sp.]|nr:dihydropteroate synthase [Candidatus Hydrogenedens sp.]
GTSNKSTIGTVLDLPVDQRIEGTSATIAWAVFKGVHAVRVHQVKEMVRVIRMTEAIMYGIE